LRDQRCSSTLRGWSQSRGVKHPRGEGDDLSSRSRRGRVSPSSAGERKETHFPLWPGKRLKDEKKGDRAPARAATGERGGGILSAIRWLMFRGRGLLLLTAVKVERPRLRKGGEKKRSPILKSFRFRKGGEQRYLLLEVEEKVFILSERGGVWGGVLKNSRRDRFVLSRRP